LFSLLLLLLLPFLLPLFPLLACLSLASNVYPVTSYPLVFEAASALHIEIGYNFLRYLNIGFFIINIAWQNCLLCLFVCLFVWHSFASLTIQKRSGPCLAVQR
jgi:hypothetical protein